MLLNIYLKEIKDCFRDRRTLLLSVLLPILIVSGMTLFYESLLSDGKEDTYTLAVNKAASTDELKKMIPGSQIKLIPSEHPERTVKDGKAQAALLLEDGFFSRLQDGQKAEASIVGDSFSQNGANLMTIVSNHLSSYEKKIVSERLQQQGMDPSILQPIQLQTKELSAEKPAINLIAMLIPMILALAIGVGSGPAASDLFAGEKERKTMEALLMTPVNRSTLLLAKWMTISTIGAITGFVTLAVVTAEIAFFTTNLKDSISFSSQTPFIILLALLLSIVYAIFLASLLVLTSIIAKTVKESQSYSTPIMILNVFPMMFLTSIGINELTASYFVTPFLNLFALLKELILGIVDYNHILLTFGSNILCLLVIFFIARIFFLKDKWVMN
ncbi:ABC transporter permease [Bacillus testis]|uniref:ABC transporter permease n=1 Tax=Bacillus testis TaxID=1622072 RepID=UPI00067F3D29|nr:ABC transporter permease subunit [Bacillus testis]